MSLPLQLRLRPATTGGGSFRSGGGPRAVGTAGETPSCWAVSMRLRRRSAMLRRVSARRGRSATLRHLVAGRFGRSDLELVNPPKEAVSWPQAGKPEGARALRPALEEAQKVP